MTVAHDVKGNQIEVGDLILYAKHSTLHLAIVLKLTRRSMWLSCQRANWTSGRWIADPKSSVVDTWMDISKHNGMKYCMNQTELLILEKDVEYPKELLKFKR